MAKPDKNTLSLGLTFDTGEPTKSARVSEDGLYRDTLIRVWDVHKPCIHIVALNPSTADGESEDPTSGRLMSFCRKFGAGRYELQNLFAYRATSPTRLKKEYDRVHAEVMATADNDARKLVIGVEAKQKAGQYIMGPDNLAILRATLERAAARGETVWGAWGAAPILQQIPAHDNFMKMARAAGVTVWCVGMTEGSDKLPPQPRHPLYVPGDVALTVIPSNMPPFADTPPDTKGSPPCN